MGAWDPPESTPWDRLGLEVVDSPSSRGAGRGAAGEGGFLPPRRRLAVVGPKAHQPYALLGSYAA